MVVGRRWITRRSYTWWKCATPRGWGLRSHAGEPRAILEGKLETIIRTLAENPLLLLFVVAAVGYPLGRIRIGGAALGTASVLFVGIAIGAIDPRLKLPDIIYLLGLAVLVYTIGLSSAQSFFRAFTFRGLRDLLLALGVLGLAGALAFVLGRAFGISAPIGAAMYSGAFTNASGLAQVVEAMKASGAPGIDVSGPVVGYSLAYPIGIIGPMIVMVIARWVFRVDLQKEAQEIPSYRRMTQKLQARTILVTAETLPNAEQAAHGVGKDVVFGRLVRGGESWLVTGADRFEPGDLVVAIGPEAELNRVTEFLGKSADEDLTIDRTEFDVRRVFVSNRDVVGVPLREMALPREQSAIVTRVRRGDIEFIPNGDTALMLGDRVRVLTRRENMPAVSKFFGDSYRALSEVDLLALCIGVALGLILGLIPIPLPGGIEFRLGFAGGPLVAALILGKLDRTGPVVWNLPYSANLTLRQFGLLLFAAGIGTRAGYEFYATLARGEGMSVFLVGMALTFFAGFTMFAVGRGLLKIPLNVLFGLYAGAQTQPVALGFAVDQTKNELPSAGYATIFPFATIFKILVAQVLFTLLGH